MNDVELKIKKEKGKMKTQDLTIKSKKIINDLNIIRHGYFYFCLLFFNTTSPS